MAGTADKTDPELWEEVKQEVTEGDKGGKPGQWSARKAQIAVTEYKQQGGGYKGRKSADNHLVQWEREEWGTKSGGKSGETGERYLPKTARDHLSDAEYEKTTEKKREDTRKGKQFSRQPPEIAEKTARDRDTGRTHSVGKGPSKAALMREAQKRNIAGRSKMSYEALARAVGH